MVESTWCIRRYLDLFDGLLSYFRSCDDQTAKVVSITERLENPLTKPILHFLNQVLPSMDRFNRSFKKSNENTMCELYTDIVRLTIIYVVNFLTEEAVRKAGDKIHLVDMDKVKLYDDLSIGDETWLCISALEEEMDTKPFFFLCVKAFYSVTLQKLFKKFPFGDTILQDLGIVQPTKTKSYTVSTIKRLAKRFPQIELDSPDSLHLLAQEFTDYVLSPEDHPALTYY